METPLDETSEPTPEPIPEPAPPPVTDEESAPAQIEGEANGETE